MRMPQVGDVYKPIREKWGSSSNLQGGVERYRLKVIKINDEHVNTKVIRTAECWAGIGTERERFIESFLEEFSLDICEEEEIII